MKIVHIITGLGDGGAEHTLYKICKYDNNNEHVVISFQGKEKYFFLLKKLGIETYSLNAGYFSIIKFFYLIKLLKSLNPDVVQTWLVHADLVGSIAARFAGIKNIVWNVRYSKIQLGQAKFTTIIIINLLVKLSYFLPLSILICSKKAEEIYKDKGYDKNKLKFIPNGYDLSILSIDKQKEITFKKEVQTNKQIPLIGNVARFDPQKDHFNLLHALSIIKSKNIDFLCVLVGTNTNTSKSLRKEVERLNLSNCVKLFGQTENITEVMNGLDLHILSSSYGEGFPNVVAEAMSCGTPSVVTDVGDAAFIVEKTGWVVPPKDPVELANAIENAINEIGTNKWNERCKNARLRIESEYSLIKMLESYNSEWTKICEDDHKKLSVVTKDIALGDKISIILPTRNNEKTIFYSIKSILNQSHKNFELIIINDCSTDKTREVIHSFNDNRIIYFENKKNLGITRSLIYGIEKATGDYIARMDGDDISIPERLETQLKFLQKNPEVNLVGSNIIYFTKNKVIGISDLELHNPKKFNFYLRPIGLPHPTWMAEANFFKNLTYNPKKESVEDQDLLLRAFNTYQFNLLKEPLVFYGLPEKFNVKVKLKRVFNLFLARLEHVRHYKLFYYFPLVFIVFIFSSICYLFGIETSKMIKAYNSKYQDLFDEMIKNMK